MKDNIYCLFNKLSRRHGDCMTFPTHEFAKRSVSERLIQMKVDLEEFELVYCGTLDIATGIVDTCDPVRMDLEVPKSIDAAASKMSVQ